jgi:hypothetical protein
MTKSPPVQNKIHEAVLETATDLHQIGLISDERMLKFKTLCSEIVKESNTHLGKKTVTTKD